MEIGEELLEGYSINIFIAPFVIFFTKQNL